MSVRIGQGVDAHALEPGRPLGLGGVRIEHDAGLAGHSDGDVLLHAIASAILGALGAGDLGRHFPSTRADLRGARSAGLLAEAARMAAAAGFVVAQVDATVIAERPRLADHTEKMQRAIADALGVAAGCVNVKVTSTDGLGAIGRGEGIAALAVVLLEPRRDA